MLMLITYCEINDIMSKLNFILEIFRRHLNQLICIPYVPNYKKKKLIFFVSNYKQKRLTFIIFNYVISQNYLFQKKIQCKVHSIWSLFHFLYNQLPMKIVFTFSYKTYFKDNTKNYVTNHCVLVFLSSVVFFSSSYQSLYSVNVSKSILLLLLFWELYCVICKYLSLLV